MDDFFFNVFIDNSPGNLPLESVDQFPAKIPKFPVSTGVFRIKASNKFMDRHKQKISNYAVPFINSEGYMTTAIIGNWYTSPSAILCSLVSTVFDRIRKRYKFKYMANNKQVELLLFRIAVLYVITKNDYLFSRLLGCLDKSWRHCKRLYWFFFRKHMDLQFRFCYNQMLLNVEWLKSRKRQCRLTSLIDPTIYQYEYLDSCLAGGNSKKDVRNKLYYFQQTAKFFECVEEVTYNSGTVTRNKGSLMFCRIRKNTQTENP